MRTLILPVLTAFSVTLVAHAHDLFLRPESFFLRPHTRAIIPVLNGTFSRSDNAVDPERLEDLSVVTPGGRERLDRSAWTGVEPRSTVNVAVGGGGTYLVAAAIKPRTLALEGQAFTAYLREEGIETVLRARQEAGVSARPARERYAKTVKTLLQVGDTPAGEMAAPLGYFAEIVPLANPYTLKVGATLDVRCFVDGRPLADWRIQAGGRRGDGAQRLPVQSVRTDRDGRAGVRITAAGEWYVKFVYMREVAEPGVDYESKWSTLTFAVR
jgi:hypothetical protein